MLTKSPKKEQAIYMGIYMESDSVESATESNRHWKIL